MWAEWVAFVGSPAATSPLFAVVVVLAHALIAADAAEKEGVTL